MNFLCKQKIVNNRSIPSMHAVRKFPFFLINTLLLYIPLLALTDRQNYGQRNEYTRFAWAGGTFSPVVLLCQFSVLAGNRFCFTYYLCTQGIVPYSCGVVLVFFVLAGTSFWCYVCTQCTIQLCGCVSFLVMAGNSSQNKNTFLQKNLIGLLFYDPLADVCFL